MINCLLFDLDGTLFDSAEANIRAYSLAFEEQGLKLDVGQYRSNFGLRFDDMMKLLVPGADQKTLIKIKFAKARYYQENLGLIKANKGLLELARAARANSIRIALVTTASLKNVESLLTYFLPNEGLFDVVVTGEDVKKGKPDPECYSLAVEKLGTTSDQCLVFEDTDLGIAAAETAGISYIKVQM